MTLKNALVSAAGNAAADRLYVEDVFSTYLYTGNGGSQTITNGIDLAGEGGMVWAKIRTAVTQHAIASTATGVQYDLSSSSTAALNSEPTGLTAFNSDGFSIGGATNWNFNSRPVVSWTFRKAPKFFDVVTYTGDGVAGRTIAHNLGAVPGCIIVKRLDFALDWTVYHRSLGAGSCLRLNTTNSTITNSAFWNNTNPTDSVFSLGSGNYTNQLNGTYVAYLFAHNAGGFGADGTENVISCGSYTGNGSTDGPEIDLGFEPQWVMIKSSTLSPSYWVMADNMRGMSETSDRWLYANLSNAEGVAGTYITSKANGFKINGTGSYANSSGQTYIYIAIRRGPMKVPESGTEVFAVSTRAGTGATATTTDLTFPPDLVWSKGRDNGGTNSGSFDRLRGATKQLSLNQADQEATASTSLTGFDRMNGYTADSDAVQLTINATGYNYVNWQFRRAPGFFDVVCYTGTGNTGDIIDGYYTQTLGHNLGAVPELAIIKNRSVGGTNSYWVVSPPIGTGYLRLNATDAYSSFSAFFSNKVYWTNTTWNVQGAGTANNAAGNTFVAYLFATLAGVSKVGSYTGTGTTNQIDCGFSGGARYVLIKRTDSTGDWYVWDSARGIVAGNDPYLLLNSTAAEVTSTDYVDTYSAGFEISSTAPAAINASGGSFIFLAIA